jgi:hypothetical protein
MFLGKSLGQVDFISENKKINYNKQHPDAILIIKRRLVRLYLRLDFCFSRPNAITSSVEFTQTAGEFHRNPPTYLLEDTCRCCILSECKYEFKQSKWR